MFWLVSFKKYSYTDNLVFTYTFYTFMVLTLLNIEWLYYLSETLADILQRILFTLIFPIYFYKSIKNFYHLNRKKTIFKFILLNILFVPFFIITLLFMILIGTLIF